MPAAAERDNAVVSPGGAAGVTADEPVPAAEPSSVSVEPEAAAAEAAEQAEQLAADAEGAAATAAPADANGSAAAAPDGAAAEAAAAEAVEAGATSAKPQRRQQDRPKVAFSRAPRPPRQEQDFERAGAVEPVPKVIF